MLAWTGFSQKTGGYQRPSFVTRLFAGYVSGHSSLFKGSIQSNDSTYGRSFFSGGMGEFVAKKKMNSLYSEGPSEDVILQWATIGDASGRPFFLAFGGNSPTNRRYSRRLLGIKIGTAAFDFAEKYFKGEIEGETLPEATKVYPNPVVTGEKVVVEVSIEFLRQN
ncbi:MAG: hypothetical protein R3B93_12000 [Bacteroidia bacterium]